ncbi:MAG: hypothetical protein Q4F43_09615 [Eubacteriales bacterium]|nr:hypothetical protein [Eubacteriales bacterium]
MNKGQTKSFHQRHRTGTVCLVLAMLTAVSLLAAGCKSTRLPDFLNPKPTATSLAKHAIKNVQNVQSAEVKADIDTEIGASVSIISLSMDMNMDLDMEMTKDPLLSKGQADVEVGMMGKNQTMHGDFYLDGTDDTTYIRWKDGEWTKKTADKTEQAQNGEGSAGLIPSIPGTGNGDLDETIAQSVSILQLIADGAVETELKEETVTVQEKEAWQINATVQGPLLKEILSSTGKVSDSDLEKIHWEEVEIPAEIYIYKNTELPARIVMDCKSFGPSLLSADSLEGIDALNEQIPVGEIELELKKCDIDLVFDRYDEIEPFEIPQEVKNAKEADSLSPDVMEMLEDAF